MIWFNEEKGHGFISTEDGERLYVAAPSFVESPPEGRCGGLPVEFEVIGTDGDREATQCAVVEDDVPRRARIRYSMRR